MLWNIWFQPQSRNWGCWERQEKAGEKQSDRFYALFFCPSDYSAKSPFKMTTWPFPQEPLTFHSLSRKQLNFLTAAWQKKLQRQFPLPVQTDAKCKSLHFQEEDILPQCIRRPASSGAPLSPALAEGSPSPSTTLTWTGQLFFTGPWAAPEAADRSPKAVSSLLLFFEHPTHSPSPNTAKSEAPSTPHRLFVKQTLAYSWMTKSLNEADSILFSRSTTYLLCYLKSGIKSFKN